MVFRVPVLQTSFLLYHQGLDCCYTKDLNVKLVSVSRQKSRE